MLDQTFIIATQGYPPNSSLTTDPEWPSCFACAIADRTRVRKQARRGAGYLCEHCFWEHARLEFQRQRLHVSWRLALTVAVGISASI